jgi:hypothetical protein
VDRIDGLADGEGVHLPGECQAHEQLMCQARNQGGARPASFTGRGFFDFFAMELFTRASVGCPQIAQNWPEP